VAWPQVPKNPLKNWPPHLQAGPLHLHLHRDCISIMPPRSATSLARAGSRSRPPRYPPCVFCSPTLFSACSQHTGNTAFVWCVCRPLVLFSAIAHSISSVMRYAHPFGFYFCFRSAPSGLVQRTGCSACGLGYPHQVWSAPPMCIARAWSRCASPVCQRTSACSPPGLSPTSCPLQVCIKLYQPKKVDLPRAHGPCPSFIPLGIAPPRGGGARSGISPCYLGRSSLCLFYFSYI
jgi:hypothetical protein